MRRWTTNRQSRMPSMWPSRIRRSARVPSSTPTSCQEPRSSKWKASKWVTQCAPTTISTKTRSVWPRPTRSRDMGHLRAWRSREPEAEPPTSICLTSSRHSSSSNSNTTSNRWWTRYWSSRTGRRMQTMVAPMLKIINNNNNNNNNIICKPSSWTGRRQTMTGMMMRMLWLSVQRLMTNRLEMLQHSSELTVCKD